MAPYVKKVLKPSQVSTGLSLWCSVNICNYLSSYCTAENIAKVVFVPSATVLCHTDTAEEDRGLLTGMPSTMEAGNGVTTRSEISFFQKWHPLRPHPFTILSACYSNGKGEAPS